MDTNQLIEGVARAVKAAEPASEFCLKFVDQSWWSCMTKAEWSGWMQAIFSVLAIGAAFVVAYVTHWLDSRRDRERELQLADHVALRVRHSLGLLVRSSTPALDLLRRAIESPLTDEEINGFVGYLATYTVDDEKIVALLPAGMEISHSLNQAYSIFAEVSQLLSMSKNTDMSEYGEIAQVSFAKQTFTSMSTAFAALENAGMGLDAYLRSRGFTVARFDQRAHGA